MTPDFIAEMAWKSSLIAGVALIALVLLRSRSAADRAAVVRLAVVLLLLLPVVSIGLPALQVERPMSAPVDLPAIADDVTLVEIETAPVVTPAVSPEPAPAAIAPPAPRFELPVGLLLTLGYLTGVALLTIRLAVGLWTLRRWTADAEPVAQPAWTAALRRATQRAGLAAPVTLLASDDVRAPLSWGLARPAILIDHDTLQRPEDADAVLAHEVAHVGRRDWVMLMLSQLAVALFWFNPLVWRLERALVDQAEEAADLAAVGGVEPVSYARTLVACGAQAGGLMVPANSIAGEGLARRVHAILDEERRRIPSGSAWTGIAMLLCVAVSAPIAALELVTPVPSMTPTAPRAPVSPKAPTAPVTPVAPLPPDAPSAPSPMAFVGPELDDLEARLDRAVEVEPSSEVMAAAEARAAAVAAQAVARVDMAAVTRVAQQAAAQVDVDDLIEMRVHGVDAAYLAELAALAPRIRLSAEEIVEAKVQGLTPARLREFVDLGYGDADIDDLVAMRIHGVTPTYIRDLASAGYRGLEADDLVAMRIHGVTADQARRAAAGGRRPSADELVEMRIRGKL